MPNELDYWLIDKEGKDAQCCGSHDAAEKQKKFFESILITAQLGPFTIVSRPRREVPEMPKRIRSKR